MAVMDGCQEQKRTPELKEFACPKCGEIMEAFVKEGRTIEEAKCDACGYVMEADSPLTAR